MTLSTHARLVLRTEHPALICLAAALQTVKVSFDPLDLKLAWQKSYRGDAWGAVEEQARRLGCELLAQPAGGASEHLPGDLLGHAGGFWTVAGVASGQPRLFSGSTRASYRQPGPSTDAPGLRHFRLCVVDGPMKSAPKVALRNLLHGLHGGRAALMRILIVSLAIQCLLLINPVFFQFAIDDVVVSRDTDFLLVLVLAYGLVTIAAVFLTMARAGDISRLDLRIRDVLGARFFKGVLGLQALEIARKPINEVASKLGSLASVQGHLGSKSIETVVDGAMSLAALVIMFVYSWRLAVVPIVSVVVFLLVKALHIPSHRQKGRLALHQMTLQGSVLVETLRSFVSLRAAERASLRLEQWLRAQAASSECAQSSALQGMRMKALHQAITSAEYIAVIALGALDIMNGRLSVGMLIAFQFYRNLFQGRAHSLVDQWFERNALTSHLEKIEDVMTTPPHDDAAPRMPLEGKPVRLEQVSFRFSPRHPWILRHASITFETGKCYGISAPSGVGKSTLAKVILGVYPLEGGEILFGDTALGAGTGPAIRKACAIVLQDDVVFQGTVSENISYFAVEPDEARVRECADQVGLTAEIESFAGGFDTPVGDGGQPISGGQKQRLLIARALYTSPALLILDEATTALDQRREAAVLKAIQQLACTRLVISHNPKVLEVCDTLLELKGGQLLPLEPTVQLVAAKRVAEVHP